MLPGAPLDPKYAISKTDWRTFWVNGSTALVEIWKDLSPTTKLLFNAIPPVNDTEDQKAWPEYRHVIMDVLGPPNFDAKYGVVSHQWFVLHPACPHHVSARRLADHVSAHDTTTQPRDFFPNTYLSHVGTATASRLARLPRG